MTEEMLQQYQEVRSQLLACNDRCAELYARVKRLEAENAELRANLFDSVDGDNR